MINIKLEFDLASGDLESIVNMINDGNVNYRDLVNKNDDLSIELEKLKKKMKGM